MFEVRTALPEYLNFFVERGGAGVPTAALDVTACCETANSTG
jgi:hypothetical protein